MWLPEVGLYHYKTRTYSPGLGRFLQADPIGYLGGMNLYAYVGNDPINNTDPWGLDETCDPVVHACDTIVTTGEEPPCAGVCVTDDYFIGLYLQNWTNDIFASPNRLTTLAGFKVVEPVIDLCGGGPCPEDEEESKDKIEKPKTQRCLDAEQGLDDAILDRYLAIGAVTAVGIGAVGLGLSTGGTAAFALGAIATRSGAFLSGAALQRAQDNVRKMRTARDNACR